METLYVMQNGVQLKKKSNRIAARKDGRILKEYRTTDLKRVLVFGNSQISTELMRFLAGRGIDVAFLSTRGRYGYRLVPETSRNIYLRMAQNERYRDPEFKLRLSGAIVRGKILNQRTFLIRYQRGQSRVDLSRAIGQLQKSADRVGTAETLDQLRGVEGSASRTYFNAFGKLLLNGFTFKTRAYHPPPDPVNALLGFGYMLVFNELSGLLEAFGFDIYLGFLHETLYGRKSLASDILEELRSPIADRLVLYLINKSILRPDEFKKEGKGILMTEPAKKKFLSNYENFMTASFTEKKDSKPTNFRKILRDRVKDFETTIMDGVDYKPYSLRA